jgi:hypothetical protein
LLRKSDAKREHLKKAAGEPRRQAEVSPVPQSPGARSRAGGSLFPSQIVSKKELDHVPFLLLSWTFGRSPARRGKRRNPAPTSPQRRHSFRLRLEALEPRLTPGAVTLASFTGTKGANPKAGLIMDSSGNLC